MCIVYILATIYIIKYHSPKETAMWYDSILCEIYDSGTDLEVLVQPTAKCRKMDFYFDW